MINGSGKGQYATTAIKQDLSPDLNPLDYAIGSLKTAIEQEWNKMSEKFILKANRFEGNNLKNGGHNE